MIYRRLNRYEKAQVLELRKKFTAEGHEVVSLRECFMRFGSKVMYGMPRLPMPLFIVGPRTFYCAKGNGESGERIFFRGD